MRYRRLGTSELRVPVIALGTLPWGGGYGPFRDRDADALVGAALDAGISLIDTAPNYGGAEELLGRALRHTRRRFVLATKCGTRRTPDGRLTNDARPENLARNLEGSLRRLRTEYIDLLQLHLPDPLTRFEETWDALQGFVRAGKVRYLGLSNFWEADLAAWPEDSHTISVQLPCNFLYREIESGLLDLCRERKIDVIAYQPLLNGLLAGVRPDPEDETDHRSGHPQFHGPPLESSLRLAERLQQVGRSSGWTAAQLALAWVVSRPGIACTLLGARRPERLQEAAQAVTRDLPEDLRQALEDVLASTPVEVARSVRMPVEEVRRGPYGPVAVLALGVTVPAPEGVQAGSEVLMDIITGKLQAAP